ncbi:MAG TPA: NIPSNAP family protein [Magnetospirillaceae bacterium]|jgi:hypothetical protein
MITLCIRYTLDFQKIDAFTTYAKGIKSGIERCGGTYVGYYLPTKIAGLANLAIGLIAFPDLATYQHYREKLAVDPEASGHLRDAMAAGCIINEERAFMQAL